MRLYDIAAAALACSLLGCSPSGGAMEDPEIPIACRLDALTPDERAREGVLLREHLDAFVEVREHDDGYSFRYPADAALFARMAELVALEHRCCPFLDLSLEWPRGDAAPWLHVRGGAEAKAFVASAFASAPRG